MSEERFAETADQVIESARSLGESVTLAQFHQVQQYARLFSRWQLEKVAADEFRQGRHTLAQTILTRAEAMS